MRAIPIIVGYALRESLRRRVFLVVLVLTAAFLGLYALGADKAFEEAQDFAPPADVALAGIDSKTLTGATVFGLSMFGTLFLGTVLAAFLTLGVVRGDAERGLLQPLVVRPVGRSTLLIARFLADPASYVRLVEQAVRLLGAEAEPEEALAGQRVDGGGGCPAAVGADVVGAQGIDDHDEDVGAIGSPSERPGVARRGDDDGAGRFEQLAPGKGHTAIMP